MSLAKDERQPLTASDSICALQLYDNSYLYVNIWVVTPGRDSNQKLADPKS
jgi:hypothetical protein